MNKNNIWPMAILLSVILLVILMPELSFAQDIGGIGGDALSQRVKVNPSVT